MTLIDELKVMNYSMIDCLKGKGISVKKNELIKEILKDEACFFKMNKEEALIVLRDLNVSNEMLEETYKKLIDRQEYYRLFNAGKIDVNDKDLKIQYEQCRNSIFEEKKYNSYKEESLIEIKNEKLFKRIFNFFRKFFKKNK